MPVRILMWNIKFFSNSSIRKAGRGTKIINQVQPAGAAANYDIFIIVEPNKFTQPTNVGEVPVAGSSVQALQTVLYALQHRDANWRMVPPRVLTTATTKEIHGVFYLSTVVTLAGPDNNVIANAAQVLPALPPVLTGLGLVAVPPSAYGGGALAVPMGNVRHSPNALAATAANEVVFNTAGQRRPYRTRFTTVVGGNTFDVYSHHAAPDQDYPANARGIENLATVHEVAEGRPHPTLLCGDFNCCPMPHPCTNAGGTGHHGSERRAQNKLTSQNATSYPYWTDAREAQRAAAGLSDAYTTFRAGVPPPVLTAPQTAQLVTDAQGLMAPLNTIIHHATTLNGVAVDVNLAALLVNATAAHAALAAMNPASATTPGAVLAPIEAAALANALTARATGVAISDFLGANLNAPVLLASFATAIHQTAVAEDELRAGNAANAATAVNAVGAAVTTGAVAVFQNLHATNHNAATTAAGNATGATAATANLGTLAVTARDALLTLTLGQYKTHIVQQLSSLKTPGTATATNYRNHAFDHILTSGFVAEANAGVVDRIAADGRNPGAAVHLNTFRAFFKRHFKGPGAGQKGISDHLPVEITVTV